MKFLRCLPILICLFSLLSCISTRLIQDKVLTFPWQAHASSSIDPASDVAGDLSVEESGNPAFPDLYLFIERTKSPRLFAELWKRLPSLMGSSGQNFLSGLENLPADWANQILLFRPASTATFQGLLVGNFPRSFIASALKNQMGWKQRILENADKSQTYIFDNLEKHLHVGLVSETALVLQSDLPGPDNTGTGNDFFDQHVRRSAELVQNGTSDGSSKQTGKSPTTSSSTLAQILQTEGKDDNMFGLLAVSLPPSVPAAAFRLRLTPVNSSGQIHIELQATILPRSETSTKSLKTGIKLALVGFSNLAGLDAGFINAIKFSEQNGTLVLSGLSLSEKGAANLLGEMLRQAVAANDPNDGKDAEP